MVFSKQPLVSIISPCYNGEKWVGRMLESILAQTYKNIEMICVDDGSTDSTAAVIASFYDKFTENGMSLHLLSQPNLGQAAAMNKGFEVFKGEYISWIDCDDFLVPDSIEKKLTVLKNNPEIGIVTANCNVVNDGNLDKVIRRLGDSYGLLNYQHNQFGLMLIGLSEVVPGCHLVRRACFEKAFPNKEIHTCREGQNAQILLPLYYLFSRDYIDEPLSYYVIREGSHYHRERTNEEWRNRFEMFTEMLVSIFADLKINENDSHKWLKQSYFYRGLREHH